MKSSKIKEYEAMTMEELQKELKELKKELFKLRFSHALNGLDNPKKITLVKKNIARVNTVITKKSNN
ncbi:50S ribosomal protein L29 [Clostridium sp. CAG:1219]|nr:50S ribosomal protein L29 [Clostridium sp. CAG:1219]